MASFMYAVMSITHVASMHCAERPEISPCTCEPIFAHNYVELSCEKVDSFHTIVGALSEKFEQNVNISLKISYSQLEDLEMRSFKDMKLNIVKLRLQWNHLRSLPELPFRGLSNVEFLSIGDNEMDEVPKHMLNHMPIVKTVDMGRCRIRSVLKDDFKGIQMVSNLFLPSNNLTHLDRGTFPRGLVTLHLGRNQIENLNGSLRDLNKLESLFINMNMIGSLHNELPESNLLKLMIAQNNRLEYLPESIRYMNRLETVQLQYNRMLSLNSSFKYAKNLNIFVAHNNEIQNLNSDEFQECYNLEELNLACNHIRSLNNSLLNLSRLSIANFSSNDIEEFSMHELSGLKYLKQLDLSFNRIQKLIGCQQKNVDEDSHLIEFKLDHNLLKSLNGALVGLNNLRILSLSFNEMERILPEDFINFAKLEILDLSHNKIKTLKEIERTFLPSLKILKVAYNRLVKLDKDFHGLPFLCQANLTNNQISSISTDLVSKTRCMNHNVPGKLELLLEDNPIMCEERLNKLCSIMLAQEARIRGRSACFGIEEEVCTVLPMLYTNVTKDIPMLSHQQVSEVPIKSPVQLIVSSLLNAKLNEDIQISPIMHPSGTKYSTVISPSIQPTQTAPSGIKDREHEQTITTTTSIDASTIGNTSCSLKPFIINTFSTSPKDMKRLDEDEPLVL